MATEKKPSSVPTADCLSQEWKPALVVVKSEPLDNEEVKLESEVVFEHEDEGMDVDRTVSQEGSVLAAPLKQEPDFPAEKVFVKVEVDNTDEENLGSSNNQDTHMEVEQNVTQEDSILTAPPKEDPKFPAESVFVKVEMGCSDDGNLNSSGNKDPHTDVEQVVAQEGSIPSIPFTTAAERLFVKVEIDDKDVSLKSSENLSEPDFTKLRETAKTNGSNKSSSESSSYYFVQCPPTNKSETIYDDSEETDVDRRLSCPVCLKRFKHPGHMKNHIGIHDVNAYPCKLCSESFRTVQALRRHLPFHPDLREFSCHQCSFRFKVRSHLDNHIARDCSSGMLGCPQCPAEYTNYWQLEQHYLIHLGEKRLKYQCEQCPRVFLKISKLTQHKLSHRPSRMKENLVCPKCSAEYVSTISLERHMKTHADDAPHVCRHCQIRFMTQHELNQHTVKHFMDGENPYQCSKCQQSFLNEIKLQQHLMAHSDAGKYRCRDCSARFVSRVHFKEHHLIHFEKGPFTCPHCSEQFQRKRYFERHVASHGAEKLFRCKHCPEWFKMESGFMQHLAFHANEKKFVCAHCGVRRKSKLGISKHVPLHMKNSLSTNDGNTNKK